MPGMAVEHDHGAAVQRAIPAAVNSKADADIATYACTPNPEVRHKERGGSVP